jgi:hypothetical protein
MRALARQPLDFPELVEASSLLPEALMQAIERLESNGLLTRRESSDRLTYELTAPGFRVFSAIASAPAKPPPPDATLAVLQAMPSDLSVSLPLSELAWRVPVPIDALLVTLGRMEETRLLRRTQRTEDEPHFAMTSAGAATLAKLSR